MKNKCLRTITLLAAGCGVSTVLIAAGDSEKVNDLLSQAKTQAYQISTDAATLESYTRSNMSWQTHAAAVEQMKARINAAGRTLAELNDAKKGASPWQATAIDRIHPLLQEIASNTSAVIERINKQPTHLLSLEYRDYIEANADLSDELSSLIADFVNYGSAKDRAEHLATELELPSK